MSGASGASGASESPSLFADLRDRCRDPRGWLLMKLPWSVRRYFMARAMHSSYADVPDGARYIVMRAASRAAIERGRQLAQNADGRTDCRDRHTH